MPPPARGSLPLVASGSDRRGFFKELLREAASVAQELSSAMRAADEPVFDDWEPPAPVPAKPARGSVDEDSLLSLAREVGLERRDADLRRLARASVRLTRGEPGSSSRLGGSPDVPRGFAWPTADGRAPSG